MKIPIFPNPEQNLKRVNGPISSRWGTLLFIILICAFAVSAVSAATPLSASFTFSPTSPEVGHSVSFADTSTGDGITSWSWAFGDGQTSMVQNPAHTYTSAGTKSVSLTISNGTVTSSPYTQSITVTVAANPPVASFSFSPTSPTVGQSVSFTDASTGDDIISWSWAFGDGQTSTVQSPTHIYTTAGTKTVSLTVSNTAGQSTPFTQSVTVTAVTPLIASFIFSPASPTVGQAVSFTGSSTTADIDQWSWSFGDGQSGTGQNPSHAYTTAGTKIVSLTVTKDGVTSPAVTQSVTVTAANSIPVASFTYSPSTLSPGTLVTFTDTSTGSPTGYYWYFGNGQISTVKYPPVQTYSTAGTYIVSLTVSNAAGTSAIYSRSIIVASDDTLDADFDYSPSSPDAGESISFTDESDGSPTSWEWDFDDNSGSESQNPSHTFSSDGEYDVKLTISKSGGYSDTVTKTVTVGESTTTVTGPKPTADFTWSPTSPVVGSAVSFTDTSTGDGIDQWSWDFDDAMDFTGNRESDLQNPQHTYENTGSYLVTLTVWNDGGSDIIAKTVNVGTVPFNARFNANPTSGTAPLTVRFVDSSTGVDIESYHWDFGNGQTYDGESPSNVVYSLSGSYTASLEITDESGDTDEYTTTITVSPPATAAPAQAAAPTATPAPAEDTGFVDGEYRKMTGLYNEYIRIIFGFLGIDDEPDFLIIAVKTSQI